MQATAEKTQAFDVVGFIIEVESGHFDHEDPEHVETLQHMIDTGMIFRLQGAWQRFAQQCIRAGIVRVPEGG